VLGPLHCLGDAAPKNHMPHLMSSGSSSGLTSVYDLAGVQVRHAAGHLACRRADGLHIGRAGLPGDAVRVLCPEEAPVDGILHTPLHWSTLGRMLDTSSGWLQPEQLCRVDVQLHPKQVCT
jgi:hypothetical protein